MNAIRVYADGKVEFFESRGEIWANMMIHDGGIKIAEKYFRHEATAEVTGSTPYRTMVYVERPRREWVRHIDLPGTIRCTATDGTVSESEEQRK